MIIIKKKRQKINKTEQILFIAFIKNILINIYSIAFLIKVFLKALGSRPD